MTKVNINGYIFSFRLLEEPFHEIVYNHKKTNREEEELSTSNSDSLDYANFAMGSDVAPSFESDGGMEIDKNDDGHLAREMLSHDGGRREVGENEVTNVVGNGAMAFTGRKTKLQSLALTDGIELNLVENSDQLVVDIGKGPVVQNCDAPNSINRGGSGGSDPISSWPKSTNGDTDNSNIVKEGGVVENSESCIGPLNNDTFNNGLVGSFASSTQSPSVGVIGGEGEGSKQPLRGGGTNVVKSPCGIETKGLKRKQPRSIMKKKGFSNGFGVPFGEAQKQLGSCPEEENKGV